MFPPSPGPCPAPGASLPGAPLSSATGRVWGLHQGLLSSTSRWSLPAPPATLGFPQVPQGWRLSRGAGRSAQGELAWPGLLGRNAAGAVSKPAQHPDPAPPNCSRPQQSTARREQLPSAIITAEFPPPLHCSFLLPLPWVAGGRDTIKARNISFWAGRASFGRKLPLFSRPLPLLLGREGKGMVPTAGCLEHSVPAEQ